jgi:hypothetical protein
MTSHVWLLSLTVMMSGGLAGAGQSPRVTRATLEQVAAQAADTESVREVTIRWAAYAGGANGLVGPATAVALNRFDVVAQRVVPGSLPRERHPDFSGDQIVVAAVDEAGTTLSWQLVPDPRILRSEGPGPDGILRGAVFYRTDPVFTFSFPADVQPARIDVLQPRATPDDWQFDLVASFPLPTRQ